MWCCFSVSGRRRRGSSLSNFVEEGFCCCAAQVVPHTQTHNRPSPPRRELFSQSANFCRGGARPRLLLLTWPAAAAAGGVGALVLDFANCNRSQSFGLAACF